MNYKNPNELERYAFLWSEARLFIAAAALLLGGVPVLRALLPIPALYGIVGLVLTISWIISGVAACYLLYRWYGGGKRIFGGKGPRDTTAFLVMVVSGINLGLVPFLGNIGMSISSNYVIFVLVAVVYILAAVHLNRRWKSSGRKMFF
jgi:hypothetical protein